MPKNNDQAANLRRYFLAETAPKLDHPVTKSFSITSGKGGVGKTSVSINLSYALASLGQKVLLIDCDFGLANVDIMLNLAVENTLEQVIEGIVLLEDAIAHTNYGFDVLPATSGVSAIADLDSSNQRFFIRELAKIQHKYNFMLFDTGAGIHKSVLRVNASVDQVILLTNTEPTSITDAYAMMKTLRSLYKVQNFWLLANQADLAKAQKLNSLLQKVANENGVSLDLALAGYIPTDATVGQAIFKRQPWEIANSGLQSLWAT